MVLAASLCKSALALICVCALLAWTRSKLASASGFIMLLSSPSMTHVTNGLSDIYLTFWVTVSALCLAYATAKRHRLLFFASGLACGLAIGSKPSGVIMLGVITFCVIVKGWRGQAWRNMVVSACGALLGLLPQIAHNLHHHDTLGFLPVAIARVRAGLAISFFGGNHHRAFFSNIPFELPPDHADWPALAMAREMVPIWLKAMFVKGEVIEFILLIPFLGALVLVLAAPRMRQLVHPVARKMIGISALMLGAGLAMSMIIHLEARYWNFLVPFTVITMVLVWSKVSEMVGAPAAVLPLLFALMLLPLVLVRIEAGAVRQLPPEYDKAASILPKDAVLYTSEPWEVAFHTRRHTVALPYSNMAEFWTLADRFDVTHIVIISGDARHRMYDELERGHFPAGIEKIHYSKRLVIGALRGSLGSATRADAP